jgi:hypothetical protein
MKVQFEEVCRNKILFLSFWDCGYFSGIMAVKEDLFSSHNTSDLIHVK